MMGIKLKSKKYAEPEKLQEPQVSQEVKGLEKPIKPLESLSSVLSGMAGTLVDEWTKEQKHTLWLGGPSRKKVQSDIAVLLREAYELAKERYKD
jgi:hypothetical protein